MFCTNALKKDKNILPWSLNSIKHITLKGSVLPSTPTNIQELNTLHIIIVFTILSDFEYVVTKKPKPRICFQSGQPREVLPYKGPGLSPFMRRQAKELRENLGPGSYEPKINAFSRVTDRVCNAMLNKNIIQPIE